MNISRKIPATFRTVGRKSKNNTISMMVAATSVLIALCALIISYKSLSIQDESYNIQKNTALSAYLQAYALLNPVIDVVAGRTTRINREKNFIEWQYLLANRGDMEVTSTQNKTKFFSVRGSELINISEEEFELSGIFQVGSNIKISNNMIIDKIPDSGVLCVEDEWKSRINSNSIKYLSGVISHYFDNIPQITRKLLVRTAIKLSEGETEDAAAQFCELLSTDRMYQ